jgi:hypothetical protein
MNRRKWALLVFELALFAVILVLPQVDLPDFTFHAGTAPITAKARISSTPVRLAAALPMEPPAVLVLQELLSGARCTTVSSSSVIRQSLLCTLLC